MDNKSVDMNDLMETLLDAWSLAQERGESRTPEAICARHFDGEAPKEVLEAFRKTVEKLKAFDAFAEKSAGEATDFGSDQNSKGFSMFGGDGGFAPALKPAWTTFRNLRHRGEGGNGKVYVAFDTQLQRDVAVKVLNKKPVISAKASESFRREVRLTGVLQHPGIVSVYAMGATDDGRPYYAMELIEGTTLSQKIRDLHQSMQPDGPPPESPDPDGSRRRLEVNQLIRGFVSICRTVSYMHGRKCTHRDIKSSNIMIDSHGLMRLLDLGAAGPCEGGADGFVSENNGGTPLETPSPAADRDPTDGDTVTVTNSGSGEYGIGIEDGDGVRTRPYLTKELRGVVSAQRMVAGWDSHQCTPYFAGPEQYEGRLRDVGSWSDVYSLGATFFHLVTGAIPKDENRAIPDRKLLHRFRSAGIEQPEALLAIARKAMRPGIADRYPSAEAMAADLDRWLAKEPVSVHAEPFAIRARRWRLRHARLTAAIASALIVSVLAFTIAFAMLSRANVRILREQAQTLREQSEKLREQRAGAVTAARAAALRGDFPSARALYDAVIPDIPPDESALRNTLEVERVRVMISQYDFPAANAALDDVSAREHLAPNLKAAVLLCRGDLKLCSDNDHESGYELVRQALAFGKTGLSEADASFARGLLADTVVDAVAGFRKTLELEAFHHRAHSAISVAFLVAGQRQDALRQIQLMRMIYPEDPLTDCIEAWYAGLTGHPEKIDIHMAHAAKRLGPQRAKQLGDFLHSLTYVSSQIQILNFGKPFAFGDFAAINKKFDRFVSMANGKEGFAQFGLSVPKGKWFWHRYRESSGLFVSFMRGKWDLMIEKLKLMNQVSPDAMFLYAEATANAASAISAPNSPNNPDEKKFREAIRLFREALSASELNAGVHYQARLSDFWLSSVHAMYFGDVKDSSLRKHMWEELPALIRDGQAYPVIRESFFQISLPTFPHEFSRILLDAWQAEDPNAPIPLRHRIRLELLDWNPQRAREIALSPPALKLYDKDPELRKLSVYAIHNMLMLGKDSLMRRFPVP